MYEFCERANVLRVFVFVCVRMCTKRLCIFESVRVSARLHIYGMYIIYAMHNCGNGNR